ncbi:MAG: hypothetical protein NTW93_11110 [Phycisphaerae bacterium]|nr:hypothetical protein [Phycisphaerae bacterium]
MNVDDICVHWTISTFDRQLKGQLSARHYILDWTKASENEQIEIMNILGISSAPPKQKSNEMWTKSETFSVGATKPDERMLRFRRMFVEKPVEEISKKANSVGKRHSVFENVNLNREYYEDETGREISMREIIQITHGSNYITFDVEGIVQLGSCTISARETWTIDKANTLFNFIQVVRLILGSSWAQKKSSITTYRKDKTEALDCDFPTVENMSAILILFRQLYASDKLMEKACEVYKEHSSNITKKSWIDHCLNNFKQIIDSEPGFFHLLQGCTVKQLFEAFLYGTGMVHSPCDRNLENRNRLSGLVRQYGREKVIMAVNISFWNVLECAGGLFRVIKQDYERWIKQDGCVGSDMFDIYSLLQSHEIK